MLKIKLDFVVLVLGLFTTFGLAAEVLPMIANSSKEIAYKYSSDDELDASAREKAKLRCKALNKEYVSHKLKVLTYEESLTIGENGSETDSGQSEGEIESEDEQEQPFVVANVVEPNGELSEKSVKFYRPWSYFNHKPLNDEEKAIAVGSASFASFLISGLAIGTTHFTVVTSINISRINADCSWDDCARIFTAYLIGGGIIIKSLPPLLKNIKTYVGATYHYAFRYFMYRELSKEEAKHNISLDLPMYRVFQNGNYAPMRIYDELTCE